MSAAKLDDARRVAFFTPAVKAMLERPGSRNSYSKLEERSVTTRIGPEEAAFINARDSFHLASIGRNGWPYTHYNRGPTGFLQILDSATLGCADLRANRQHISPGKILLFLMDYTSQKRLKIWAEAEVCNDPLIIERLTDGSYGATINRPFLFRVSAFEWNRQQ
jgi:hypothetical protein